MLRGPHAATVALVGVLTVILGAAAAPPAGNGGTAVPRSGLVPAVVQEAGPPIARTPARTTRTRPREVRRATGRRAGKAVNPLLRVPFADPGYYVENGRRFIYATGHDPERRTAFRVARADPGAGRFGRPRPSMRVRPRWVGPRGSRHARSQVHMWSPHVWKRQVRGQRRYVMYFSASRHRRTDCIGMAVASRPTGPFRPLRRPLQCPRKGATLIDPAYFRAPGGAHYLIYKRRVFSPRSFAIMAVRVRPDGRKVRRARPFVVVDGRDRQIEAPSMIGRKGRIYLFSSRRSYATCAYRTEVFVGRSVAGPFRSLGPLRVRKRDGRAFCGPGGAEVARVAGRYEMVFHAFPRNPQRARGTVPRFAWGARLRFTRSGHPYLEPARRAPR